MKYLYSFLLIFSITYQISAKGKYNEVLFPTEGKFIQDACLSANGKVIVCTDIKTLKAFSVDDKSLIGNFTGGHRNDVLCVDLSPDSYMLASGGNDSTVILWDFNSQTIIQRITFATGKITSIKFSPDNQFILFGCSNSSAYLYNIKEKKVINEFTDQKKDVTSVAFSQDGSLIAIAGGDKRIRLYNTANFQLQSELKGHTNWVRSIRFYNNDQNLISCGDDKKILQWNLSKHKFNKLNTYSDWIICVDINDITIDYSNLYAYGTLNGSVAIDCGFGSYRAKLKSPVSKVIFLPKDSGLIEIAVATLGSGLMYISAANLPISK